MNIRKSLIVIAATISSACCFAEIIMPKIFSDNMILQRQEVVNVWGKSDANAKVDVEFGWQKISTKADSNGNWSVKLAPMQANKTPQEMTISENGNAGKRIKNVVVGEIWVLAGQSNMEWRMSGTTDFELAKKRANYPNIRTFDQQGSAMSEKPQSDSPQGAHWVTCTPQSLGSFSGVGFYFAEMLQKDLGDIPVGLLYTPLGATAMYCWIPEEAFGEIDELAQEKQSYQKEKSTYTRADYEKKIAEQKKYIKECEVREAKARAEGKKPAGRDWIKMSRISDFTPRPPFRTPYVHYNAKVHPLVKFTARGVLWYQGESDSGGWQLENFEKQFSLMISQWRKAWSSPDMPFLFVQLTSYATSSDWAATRWAQLQCAKNIPNIGMANTIDLGEKNEIHPRNKTDVGRRLEKIALRKVYGMKDIKAFGPVFDKVEYNGSTAKVLFNCDGLDLMCQGKPRGFEILSNGKWYDCDVKVGKKTVDVKSKDGSKIEGVRYLWKSWAQPDVCIFNTSNLPATSFTDTKGKF